MVWRKLYTAKEEIKRIYKRKRETDRQRHMQNSKGSGAGLLIGPKRKKLKRMLLYVEQTLPKLQILHYIVNILT